MASNKGPKFVNVMLKMHVVGTVEFEVINSLVIYLKLVVDSLKYTCIILATFYAGTLHKSTFIVGVGYLDVSVNASIVNIK